MKFFWSTKSKITNDKNDKNVVHLEITEVVKYKKWHAILFNLEIEDL